MNHFHLSEFQARGFPQDPSPEQLFMLGNLRDHILNPIRDEIGTSMVLTDCCRSVEKFQAMILEGKHNPSTTSDHFWGQPVPCSRPQDIARFGKVFKYSVGAVDFVAQAVDMRGVFTQIVGMAREGVIQVGQVILESGPGGRWIHISNPKGLIFSPAIISRFGLCREKYLTSEDNGLTYQPITF